MNKTYKESIFRHATVLAVAVGLMTGCEKLGIKKQVEVEKIVGLDFATPIHFLSHNVEAEFPTSSAILKPDVITKVDGAALSIQSHPDNQAAQLRVIQLPKSIQATEEVARILGESGAVQDCDIILSFRPEWAAFNGYCNIQLGISHTAMATIESVSGTKFVKTVESPLNYSSRLNYPEHYVDLDYFHIIRPTLTTVQKKNIKEWSKRILATDKSKISFFGDYGTPYQYRKLSAPASGNPSLDLAKTVIYPGGNLTVSLYCSEFVWGVLALRDIDPAQLLKAFPTDSGADVANWIADRISPMFPLLEGASQSPLTTPGLMQGPDVQLRSLYGGDDEGRRRFLLDEVLLTKVTNPAETEGRLSVGHVMAANMFRAAKLPHLRAYYGAENEAASFLPTLNNGLNPNYAPTSFFALSNLPKSSRLFSYVGTVSFKERTE